MIIDRRPVAGTEAYLRDVDGTTNLGGPRPRTGRFAVNTDGLVVKVDGIDVLVMADDLQQLLARSDAPLVEVTVTKEVFPGLFAEPYRHRVHTVGGSDDLARGELVNLRVLEVEGRPTLVTTGTETSLWRSPLYALPAGFTFSAAAWDLSPSRMTPAEAFDYRLALEVWQHDPQGVGPPDAEVVLIDLGTPQALRAAVSIDASGVAYRVVFTANVRHDAFMRERHILVGGDPSVGRPLLRAVHLLEPTDSPLVFHSLNELLLASSDSSLLGPAGGPPTALTARLDVAATLGRGEAIALAVLTPVFTRLDARLAAMVFQRPLRRDEAS